MATRKRIIAVQRSRGRIGEGVELLNKHLTDFPTDVEAWHELAEVYLSDCCYQKAQFCFCELVLQDPVSIYAATTYAELLATTGDMEQSVKYYCHVLTLDERCTRALWGLLSVLSTLCGGGGTGTSSGSSRRQESIRSTDSSPSLLLAATKLKLVKVYDPNRDSGNIAARVALQLLEEPRD
eukprot:GHVU01101579.1.p1 GENE.GHVU01101579.1~~GHVU01101579.1.p1  ORF type:complete len:181 (-),score=19.76 GHVU01101579.1:12-554(-)